MKIAIAASLLFTASAFAPNQQSVRSVAPVQATAELENMVGVGPETGNKIVSVSSSSCFWNILWRLSLHYQW